MVRPGETAPEFTAPIADGDVGTTTLSTELEDAPVVLAFFPAAFTSTCTDEMCTFRDQLSNFDDVGATVLGVSVDLPFTLEEFRRQHDLNFPLVSDANRKLIRDYDVVSSFEDIGVDEVARRSVFVVDEDGEVTYRWLAESPGVEPDYDEVREAAAAAE
ncbi:MAG: redoxin domain-containing protein [Haloferacaceae archaeon]